MSLECTTAMELTERELKEIQLALYYESDLAHGTDGHNRIILLAKLARHVGFELKGIDWPELWYMDKLVDLEGKGLLKLTDLL